MGRRSSPFRIIAVVDGGLRVDLANGCLLLETVPGCSSPLVRMALVGPDARLVVDMSEGDAQVLGAALLALAERLAVGRHAAGLVLVWN